MSKSKFKTGDLVENKFTKEVEMVEYVSTGIREIDDYPHIIESFYISNGVRNTELLVMENEKDYRLISPKSVKFNLK